MDYKKKYLKYKNKYLQLKKIYGGINNKSQEEQEEEELQEAIRLSELSLENSKKLKKYQLTYDTELQNALKESEQEYNSISRHILTDSEIDKICNEKFENCKEILKYINNKPVDNNAIVLERQPQFYKDVTNFKLKIQKNDGNCLFHALANAVNETNDEHSHKRIRLYICDELRANPKYDKEIFEIYDDEERKYKTVNKLEYLKYIKIDKKYGDLNCIQAFSDLRKCTINIYMVSQNVIHRIIKNSEKIINLLYSDGKHYDLLE
jgi:hypothetical protein